MTLLATRVRLLGTLLRSGDAPRIARLIERLDAADVSRLLLSLNDFELRRAAQVLLTDERLARSIDELDVRAVARLIAAAAPSDAERALAALQPRTAAALLTLVSAARRTRLLDLLAGDQRREVNRRLPRGIRPAGSRTADSPLFAALRLRRLFA